ncbi:aldo/keto reductase [Halomonas urumqiensis]|uniref:Aldo/keto reductase n=1 Tax=Halomonas urumqiensis TaxID=1684789 RepID=A0A2N7UHK5_9GAMM|nr:aldo/keto reductase [Halomonas urumqiensis]PMR79893.1 aldo/keto reductase [Halomonas urumqiensis]PTB02082.1 aldo/keto reductase [Halomonas urumqiensis]GHE21525.1 aryl-alcohol dehydrogenase [Halomonas urumqiensis]
MSLPHFEVSFLLGMMRLHEVPELHDPMRLADWIEARLDEGLDGFDHADIYGDRQGEALFGEALRRRPGLAGRLKVVSKASIVTPERDTSPLGIKHYDSTPDYLTASIDASLARLTVDRLDVFLLHRPDPLMDAEATGRALDDAIAAGKIASVGISNFAPEQWRRLQANMHHRLCSHQLQLSLAHSEPLFDGSFDALVGDGLTPMIWSPLGGGRVMTGPARELLLEHSRSLGISPAGLALAWLRALPGRPLPVIGSLRAERIATLKDDATAALPRATWYALLEAARGHEVA